VNYYETTKKELGQNSTFLCRTLQGKDDPLGFMRYF